MNVHVTPPEGDGVRTPDPGLGSTEQMQLHAADPASSAWVSANAGAGKTYVLSLRVVRLLLEGVPPSRILCLTYTKAGAAQMTARVHSRLAEWARMDGDALAADLVRITGEPPTDEVMDRARRLFARALETPGGLKIQTIHSFCEAVLHRFPLEANVSGRFRLVDDAERDLLMRGLRAEIIAEEGGDDADSAVEAILRHGQEHALDELLRSVEASRLTLMHVLGRHGGVAGTLEALRERFGIEEGATAAGLIESAWPLEALDEDRLSTLEECARRVAGKTNLKCADIIAGIRAADGEERLALIGDLLLTQKSEVRVKDGDDGLKLSASFTGPVQKELPWLLPAMLEAATEVLDLRDRVSALALCEASAHALVFAERLQSRWRRLKHQRGLLDFDDLIARTAELLDRNGGGAWVHYKLDRGIDHILVDEAQDTSPSQWRVIGQLAGEFFNGDDGSRDRRTIFAVGDFKQSIYSFQGAEPFGFTDRQRHFAKLARNVGQTLREVQLHLSFRSVPDVLAAVDAVFGAPGHGAGLTPSGEPVVHEANRRRHAGHVDIWPVETRGDTPEPEESWTDAIDKVRQGDPVARTAQRVADTIAAWLRDGERLEAAGRPIRPGDVLVLVRKRDAFPAALTRELKDRGVPVAGADRLQLTAHVAVEDLMAIGRVTLNPHDDLSLAAALKSPLLGLGEDDLFALAHDRPEDTSLYRSLRRRAGEDERWGTAAERIAEWRQRVDTEPVFEFYARILGPDGGRRAFLSRLGEEATDVLDEFLARALETRQGALPGMESFLADLATEAPVIKREMEADGGEGPGAVRVMTVHAAKGLEAPIVFLVDCGSEPSSRQHEPRLVPVPVPGARPEPGQTEDPLAWVPSGLARPATVKITLDALKERNEEEYRRLLYVGMTRAEDRLIVCGYAGKDARDDTWHAMVSNALIGHDRCRPVEWREDDGGTREPVTYRFRTSPEDETPAETGTTGAVEELARREPPPWLHRRAAHEDGLPQPLAPCGTTALIEGEAHGVAARAGPVHGSGKVGSPEAMRRGTIVHRLLQVLPGWEAGGREAAARRYAERACSDMEPAMREAIVGAAMRVLADPGLSSLFEGEARTEVPVMGTLDVQGRPIAISGVIDRMVLTPGRLLLVDYKTGRNPPSDERGVPPVHVAQMALYRALVAPLFPDRVIDCALVYTENVSRFDLAGPRMDAMLARILERGSLDAEGGGLAPPIV